MLLKYVDIIEIDRPQVQNNCHITSRFEIICPTNQQFFPSCFTLQPSLKVYFYFRAWTPMKSSLATSPLTSSTSHTVPALDRADRMSIRYKLYRISYVTITTYYQNQQQFFLILFISDVNLVFTEFSLVSQYVTYLVYILGKEVLTGPYRFVFYFLFQVHTKVDLRLKLSEADWMHPELKDKMIELV